MPQLFTVHRANRTYLRVGFVPKYRTDEKRRAGSPAANPLAALRVRKSREQVIQVDGCGRRSSLARAYNRFLLLALPNYRGVDRPDVDCR